MEGIVFDSIIALLTLTAMEIVLGIDNIVFIAILSSRVEESKQPMARKLGLLAAMLMRILLLFSVSIIATLTKPWITLFGHGFSGRDLIMLTGGLFLIAKATYEIHHKFEGPGHNDEEEEAPPKMTMKSLVIQIMLIDIVFSIDSVITAIGMSDELWVMVTAIVIAVGSMMIFAESVSAFIEKHPTVKMLALSFLILIGVMLTFEGFGGHIEKGYIYFAMGFSLFVEMLNMRLRKAGKRISKGIEKRARRMDRPRVDRNDMAEGAE